MFPLINRKTCGYSFGERTSYTSRHLGQDYSADNDALLAPFKGEITRRLKGTQGGNTIWFKPDNQDVIMRFMHLSEMPISGRVVQGQTIGVTGNTGSLSTGPHLHIDISKKDVDINNFDNFIDPEEYNWDEKGDEIMNEAEVKEMIKATIHDFLGYEPSESDVQGHYNAMLDRKKDGNNYCMSEFIHDRFKEMPKKDECCIKLERIKEIANESN